MNFLKWKREILFLIPSITGGGTSSLFFTNAHHKNGTWTWKKKENINSFLQSVGINENSNLQPSDLLKEASNYSTIIPTLSRALAIQVAKQIFNGNLYKSTKYENSIGKLYPKLLLSQKQKIEHQIKTLSKNKKRIKKKWIHDEKKYLEGLKDYVLSRIDEKNIQEYFTTDSNNHLFKGKNIQHISTSTNMKGNSTDAITPLLGFLIGVWIQNHKAGYYVHNLIPYATSFSEKTQNFYTAKFKDIRLPEKPDYFFPDYEEKSKENNENLFKEYIDKWLKGKKSFENWWSFQQVDRSAEIKEDAKIEWISPTNSTHKNIALRYLTEKTDNSQSTTKGTTNGGKKYLVSFYNAVSSIFLRDKQKHNCDIVTTEQNQQSSTNSMHTFSTFWGNLSHNPLNLFCINDSGKNHPDFMMFIPDGQAYKSEDTISSKIIFYRDEKGFNMLYPINKKIIDEAKKKNEENKENLEEIESLIKKSELVSEFKKYIENNFSYLLLKYHSFIKNGNSSNGKKNNTTCSCDEIIKKMIELIELSQTLKDWDTIWKFYDIRKTNNSVLTASTTGKTNYLNKMGTADINPPSFLKSRIQKDLPKLNELQKTIQEYIQKTSQYLNGTNSSNNQQALKFEKKSSSEGENYWIVENTNTSKKQGNLFCMKREVMQYLLESIFTQQLINKYLKIPLLFESSRELFKNQNSSSATQITQVSTTSHNNSWEDKFLDQNWKGYLQADGQNTKLTNLLTEKIKKANILSRIESISDTTLHYLTNSITKQDSTQQSSTANSINTWDNIESFISLTNFEDSNHQLNEQLKVFITSLYLMENSFEEYRENIRKIIKDEGFGVYAFTLSWNKYCSVDDFLLDPIQKVEMDSFWTPINSQEIRKNNNGEEWDKKIADSRQCIKTSDRLAISSLKKRHSGTNPAKLVLNLFISILEGVSTNRNLKNEELMGFKGLISSDDIKKLPEEFYYKIFNFLYKEGHINWVDIEAQIQNFKTNHQLNEYVKKVNNINPSIGKTFEFSDVRQKPTTTDEAKNVYSMDWFNLTKRKELLIKFIKENLLKTQPKEQKRFQGLLFEKEKSEIKNSYVFEKDENASIAYLIQITTDDLKDNNSFLQFVKDHLTPESLIQDVVKQAQNKALQMKAINNFLARGKWINGKKVFNLRSGDYFLKNQFSSIITT